MNENPCRSCGEELGASAKYCSTCGASTGLLFDLGTPDLLSSSPETQTGTGGGALRWLGGLLAGLLIVGALIAVVVLPGGDDGSNDAAEEEQTETPAPTPTSGVDASTTEEELESEPVPVGQPTTNPTAVARGPQRDPFSGEGEAGPDTNEQVDPLVPIQDLDLGWGQLVLVDSDSIELIGLSSGETELIDLAALDLSGGTRDVLILEAGIALGRSDSRGTNNVTVVPFDRSETVPVSEVAESLFAGAGVYIGNFDDPTFSFDIVWFDGNQPRVTTVNRSPFGLATMNGRPAVAVAGGVYLATDSAGWTRVATGGLVTSTGPGLLVQQCDANMVCGLTVFNADLQRVGSIDSWGSAGALGSAGLRLSPDLAWAAQVSDNGDEVVFYDLNNQGVERTVATPATFIRDVSWSPDGRWLLVDGRFGSWVVYPDTLEIVTLPVPPGLAAVGVVQGPGPRR